MITYDSGGNAVTCTDARGVVTNWTYDALGRVTATSFPAAPAENITYSYDDATPGHYGIGRLAGYSDRSGTTALRYDARGNVVWRQRTIGAQTYPTEYAYDSADRLMQMTYPSGRTVDYARDALGRVTGVTTKANAGAPVVTIASGIGYEAFGSVSALTYGNGATAAWGYDLDGRLASMNIHDGLTPILDLDYTYDLAGNITGIADAGGGSRDRSYGYDALHRLTAAVLPDEDLAYSWDAVGNRTERTITPAKTTTETYASDTLSNRLDDVTIDIPRNGSTPPQTILHSFAYGDTGQVTLDDWSTGLMQTLLYDQADRLVQVDSGAITIAEYRYGASGQRASKDVGGVVTHYLYGPGGTLLAEANGGTGAALAEYVWLGGVALAKIDASGAVNWIHSDHRAAPQRMTDDTGAVVWDASYRPFGEVTAVTGPGTLNLRLPGQYADAETGYYDNWHRTYDPSLGRYLQSDPIGLAGGWNSYAYVGGNPVMQVDPAGLESLLGGGGMGANPENATPADIAFATAGTLWPLLAVPSVATGAGWAGSAYGIWDYGGRWWNNYAAQCNGGIWGARPELSYWDIGFMAAGPLAKLGGWAFGALGTFAKAGKGVGNVWGLNPLARGRAIEDIVAKTDYSDWYRVGDLNNGKFPLVDFQKGNNLVSLKSVDTAGNSWMGKMADHIADLGKRGATVNGAPANMILDIRVPTGGLGPGVKQLQQLGQRYGVKVIASEF